MDSISSLLTMDQWAILSAIATFVSTGVAIVQFVRFRNERTSFNSFLLRDRHRIWGDIQLLLTVYDELDKARTPLPANANLDEAKQAERFLFETIAAARGKAAAMYLRLLEQAVNHEEEFTEETVREWKAQGRLETDWRHLRAMKFVVSKPTRKRTILESAISWRAKQ